MKNRSSAAPHLHCVAWSGWGRPRSLPFELRITTARDWWIPQIGCTLALSTCEMVRIVRYEEKEFVDGVVLRQVRLPAVLSASLLASACRSR